MSEQDDEYKTCPHFLAWKNNTCFDCEEALHECVCKEE